MKLVHALYLMTLYISPLHSVLVVNLTESPLTLYNFTFSRPQNNPLRACSLDPHSAKGHPSKKEIPDAQSFNIEIGNGDAFAALNGLTNDNVIIFDGKQSRILTKVEYEEELSQHN